jgi:hypothetical protein
VKRRSGRLSLPEESRRNPKCQVPKCRGAKVPDVPDVPRGQMCQGARAVRSDRETKFDHGGTASRSGTETQAAMGVPPMAWTREHSLASYVAVMRQSVASRRMLPGFRRPRGRFAPERTHGRSPQAAPDAPAVCGFAREFVQRPAEGRPRGLLVVRVPPCLRASAVEFSSPRVSLVRRSSRPSNRSSANQYRLFCWRTRSNFAVSAIAMTAMTPA